MFGFFFRLLLIGLVIYLLVLFAFGKYQEICNYYWWMNP